MLVVEVVRATISRGERRALDGVDLEIGDGELIAVLGPNGAGKTTLLELLLGLSEPRRGRVAVFGDAPGSPSVVGRIGAMLQDAGLPGSLTVREVIDLVAHAYPRPLDVDDVIGRVRLTGRRAHTIATLSGGERQRVLLAMALVGAPDLLVLDEPTTAMDAEAKRCFWQQVLAARENGTTVVFATHDLVEAERSAERVVVLIDGRVAVDGGIEVVTTQFGGSLERFYRTMTAATRGAAA